MGLRPLCDTRISSIGNALHNDTLEISYHVIFPHYSLSSFPEQRGNHHEDPKALLHTLDQRLIYDHD